MTIDQLRKAIKDGKMFISYNGERFKSIKDNNFITVKNESGVERKIMDSENADFFMQAQLNGEPITEEEYNK